MSTYVKVITHGEINAGIRSLKLGRLRKIQPVHAETLTTIVLRVLMLYKGISPLLHYIASWMILPVSWREAVSAFIEALDLLAAMPIVPAPPPSVTIVATAAADTPTTDPTSTDPSFKAGKDL